MCILRQGDMLVKSTVSLMMSFFLVLVVLITEANSYASRRGGVVDKPSTSPQPALIAPLLMEEQADSSIDMQTGEKLRGGLISVAQQIVDASIGTNRVVRLSVSMPSTTPIPLGVGDTIRKR